MVRGDLRTAAAAASLEWCGTIPMLRLRGEPRQIRDAVAEHYAEYGLAEHASIASLARFVLELMAVGAPAGMVDEAQVAMADEVRHAQICFAIASEYGQALVGPGPLPVAGALDRGHDLVGVVGGAMREGCIGETLAAVELEQAATRCRDRGLARVLVRMAQDELRHAQLAWRVLSWALERADAMQRRRMAETMCDAIVEARVDRTHRVRPSVDPAGLEPHGILRAAEVTTIHRVTLREVVEPCARALLDGAGVPADA